MNQIEIIESVYSNRHEFERLDLPRGRLEFLRTLEIIGRHLPAPPANLADIGGGPGAYTVHFAKAGYRVIHRDILPLHVEEAKARAVQAGLAVDAAFGDARSLELPDAAFDTVLLLGPLYHLHKAEDRVKAWHEAKRILRPGGYIFAAAISRWAPLLHGFTALRFGETHPEFSEIEQHVRATGELKPLWDGDFQAYCHTSDELRTEAMAAGLNVIDLVSVEGIAIYFDDLGERLEDAKAREIVLESARRIERAPDLMGLGPHYLITAQKL